MTNTLDGEQSQLEINRINRFAFVVHPLDISFIHQHPHFGWTRYLPDGFVEEVAVRVPPIYLSRITGIQSPVTGQRVEGFLYTLGGTPRKMMVKKPQVTYARLEQVARLAARRGAGILGLGAFTSVVGDAGSTLAETSTIGITTGNSLTAAAALEATRIAVKHMGYASLAAVQVMVIGATGSIGSVCARLLAEEVSHLVLVSLEERKLEALKCRIGDQSPGCQVITDTDADEHCPECDVILTATSALDQRILDISLCKPGSIICDVARPPDIREREAALRPDVLVIEGGEIIIPGDFDIGYDIGLPPGIAYACLAETALLAMEGRFDDFTLGREISVEQVKDIYRLFQKHKFQIASLTSYGKLLTDEDVAQKRRLGEQYRKDPMLFSQVQARAASRLQEMPEETESVKRSRKNSNALICVSLSFLLAGLAGWVLHRHRKKRVK